jgi:hypothetical protein
MGQVLHGCATTTEAVRRAIQHSQESLRSLAKRYGVDPKTVAKWKARTSVSDCRPGLRSRLCRLRKRPFVMGPRRYTLLPLHDCRLRLATTIPHLTRSSLHHCVQRHRISLKGDCAVWKMTAAPDPRPVLPRRLAL